ncbi:MAG: hypothetical protein BGO59_23260 [Spirosoma sp. 48-14]|nr:MAG: hypothetical protein BGO59_23260 [Spirosoma sp. 48-14]
MYAIILGCVLMNVSIYVAILVTPPSWFRGLRRWFRKRWLLYADDFGGLLVIASAFILLWLGLVIVG